MLMLLVYRIPTGLKARIDDVVVDEAARGQGAGEALTREAMRLAAEAGARTVELTSRPEREAANRLISATLDPISRMPEFKLAAVRIVGVSPGDRT